jgi:predicted RNase H-like HicB family nuclease
MSSGAKYTIILEKTDDGYSAYVPDLPGCIAAGDTYDETVQLMREAIEFHLEGMRLNGEAMPEPTSVAETVEVGAP